MLKITLTSGLIAKQEKHRKVVRALGLGKYGSSVVRPDTPTIRGMVHKVHYLVTVTDAPEHKESTKSPRTKVKSEQA